MPVKCLLRFFSLFFLVFFCVRNRILIERHRDIFLILYERVLRNSHEGLDLMDINVFLIFPLIFILIIGVLFHLSYFSIINYIQIFCLRSIAFFSFQYWQAPRAQMIAIYSIVIHSNCLIFPFWPSKALVSYYFVELSPQLILDINSFVRLKYVYVSLRSSLFRIFGGTTI